MDLIAATTRAELLAVTGPHDAFGRLALPERPEGAHVLGRAVGHLRRTRFHGASFTAWTTDAAGCDDVADLVHAASVGPLARGAPGPQGPQGPQPKAVGVTVPFDCVDRLTRHGRVLSGGDWVWMWTDAAPPPTPEEERVEPLDDGLDAAELAAFGPAHNPRWEGAPGQGVATRWLGVREEGRIVACGAVHRLASGAAHLSGILVRADRRGRGLGRAVTAALTREVVTAEGDCTLGVYADNAAARGLYAGLGYRTTVVWASRGYLPRRP